MPRDRERELLETTNRYLERARKAEAENKELRARIAELERNSIDAQIRRLLGDPAVPVTLVCDPSIGG
jgi:hypothetical protein